MLFITHTKSRMRRLISVYLDGELNQKRTRQLMAHLETCAKCNEELAAGKLLTSAVAAALRKEDTPDILADVLSALNREKSRESFNPRRLFIGALRPALAYSTAAIFGIAAGILISSSFGASTTTAADPLPVQYLSEAPPNSLVNVYYGDTGEVTNE
jgi:anti-sigma factor RsiW